MRGRNIVMLCILSILLSSCIKPEQIEKIGIINTAGLDVAEDELLEATLVIFQFSPYSNKTSQVRYGKGYTVRDAIGDVEHSTSYKLTPGKMKVQMFGKDIVKKGIAPYLDVLTRNAQITDRLFLTVSDTTAKEILSIDEKKLSKDVGQYLFELIENESTINNIPRKTLQDFFRVYYKIGKDNVLPIFDMQEGVPKQNAIAILRGDKYVGEISNEQSILINLMNNKITDQLISVTLPVAPFKRYLEKNENPVHQNVLHTSFTIEKGSGSTQVVDATNLTFQTDLNLQLELLEQSAGVIMKDDNVIKLLEKEVEKNYVSQFQDLLHTLQEMNADPFGYGQYYNAHKKEEKLTDDEWRIKFPDINVNFNVHVKIIRSGITD